MLLRVTFSNGVELQIDLPANAMVTELRTKISTLVPDLQFQHMRYRGMLLDDSHNLAAYEILDDSEIFIQPHVSLTMPEPSARVPVAKRPKTRGSRSSSQSDLSVSPYPNVTSSPTTDVTVLPPWDTDSKECFRIILHPGHVRGVFWSDDGTMFATGCADGGVRMFRNETGECIAKFQYRQHDSVFGCCFTADSKLLLSGHHSRVICIWDVDKRELAGSLYGHDGDVYCVTTSPTNDFLIASCSADSNVKMWDLYTRTCISTLRGHRGHVFSCRFSPDGNLLASCGTDKTVRLWCTGLFTNVAVIQHPGFVMNCAFSRSGRMLVSSGSPRTVRIWDESLSEVCSFEHESEVFYTLLVDNDEQVAVCGGTTLALWDIASRQRLKTLQGHTSEIFALGCPPDGSCIASSSSDSTVRFWRLDQDPLVLKDIPDVVAEKVDWRKVYKETAFRLRPNVARAFAEDNPC